jgi:hypothetical protein
MSAEVELKWEIGDESHTQQTKYCKTWRRDGEGRLRQQAESPTRGEETSSPQEVSERLKSQELSRSDT